LLGYILPTVIAIRANATLNQRCGQIFRGINKHDTEKPMMPTKDKCKQDEPVKAHAAAGGVPAGWPVGTYGGHRRQKQSTNLSAELQ